MSPAFELLHAIVLSLTAGFSLLWIGRARSAYGEAEQPALFCALLGFTFAAGAGGCAVARLAFDMDALEAQRWLQQASELLGLPLIAAAALTRGRGWAWSRPNWGRLVLGLCAFFELARQLGWSEHYALGLGLSSALLVLYAGLLQWPARPQTLTAVIASGLMLATLPLDSNPLGDYRMLFLALVSPLLAWLLLSVRGNRGGNISPAV